MKKLIFSLSALIISTLSLSAQSKLEIKEAAVSYSHGSQNAFQMLLPMTNAKEAGEQWKDFFSDRCDAKPKLDKKSGEYFADEANVKGMFEKGSNNRTDVYAKFEQSGENTVATFWFDLGGAHLNSQDHSNKVPAVQTLLQDFGGSVAKGLVMEQLKAEKKKLEDLQDQKKDLVKQKNGFDKDIEGYKKDIEDYKKKIADAEKKIEDTKGKITKNGEEQSGKQKEVDTQADVVKGIEKKLGDMK